MRLRSASRNTNHQNNVVVKQSKICTGVGVFAKRPLKQNTVVTEYHGKVQNPKTKKQEEYSIELNNGGVLVGNYQKATIEKGVAQFTNDALCPCITGKTNNVTFHEYEGKVFVRTKRFIHSGEELLVHYGWNYWDDKLDLFKGGDHVKLRFHVNLWKYMLDEGFELGSVRSHEISVETNGDQKHSLVFSAFNNTRFIVECDARGDIQSYDLEPLDG